MNFTEDEFNRDKNWILGVFNKALAEAEALRKTEADAHTENPAAERAAVGKEPASRQASQTGACRVAVVGVPPGTR